MRGHAAAIRLFVLFILIATVAPAFNLRPALAQTLSPDEQLAQKYTPAVYIKTQPTDCSATGEAYLPVPVEIVFGDPEVKLRQHVPGGDGSSDPVIMTAPTAKDLAGLDSSYYLDLPGNSRNPGCVYEDWSRAREKELGLQPTVYARVATEADRPGQIVLQYWFYWPFDIFNNTHESDWEMIQLYFNANSVEEALTRSPDKAVYAQHGGGEKASWDSAKLQKVGDRPVVYPAAGSHASYYSDSIWLGWGANGSGFGCDAADPPSSEITPQVILMPDSPDPTGNFAWLSYKGHWGQHEAWEFNGPVGPNVGPKWTNPVTWADNVRESSLALPHSETLGPGAEKFFCSISSTAGTAMRYFPLVNPKIIASVVVILFVVLMFLALKVWRYILTGIHFYGSNLKVFLPMSILLAPVAFLGARIDDAIASIPFADSIIGQITGQGSIASVVGSGAGSVQQLLALSFVAPVIILVTKNVLEGVPPHARQSWGIALRKVLVLIGANALNNVLLALMSVTIILIPLAIKRGVQWIFTPHAVVIDGATWRSARNVSRAYVIGDWWRTLSVSLLIYLVGGVPGPLIAALMLLGGFVTLKGAELMAGVFNLITFPIAVIASTIFYLEIALPGPKVKSAHRFRLRHRRDASVSAPPESEAAPA